MTFKPSVILKTSVDQTPIDLFIEWFNNSNSQSITAESVINQPNILLFNQTGESIKIETVREIKEQLAYGAYQPNQTRYIVFLNAHLATTAAQNALLKTIEEPPQNTQIVLVSHLPNRLLDTILSRCQLVNVTLQSKDTAKQTDFSELAQLYLEIISSNPGKRLTLAAQYKEREDALNVCNMLVSLLHSELTNKTLNLTTKQITQNSMRILETIKHLEANVNPLLALENCFIELI